MSFRFEHPDRPVGDNLRRAAKGELDRAIAEVSETGFEVHGTVRNVRRRLKRVRSILRLIRPVFPDYAVENAALRDTGAEVAALRDAQALVEAADGLSRGREGEEAAALDGLRRALAARATLCDAELDREAFLTRLRAKLREARVRSELWELDGAGRKAVIPGFVSTYRQAQRGLRRVLADSDEVEALHEWRKIVKHHWAHLSLLRGLAPEFSEPRREHAGLVARTLGEHQNLSLLNEAVEDAGVAADTVDLTLVKRLVAAQMQILAKRALRLGEPLFADKPAAVERRWHGYWDDWRAAMRLGGGVQ